MQVILKLHWNILKLIACPNHISKKCGLACSIIYPEAILSLDFESLQLEKQHSKLVKTQPLFVLSYHGHFIDSAAAFHAGVFECKIVPVFLTNTFILFSKQYLDTRNVNLLSICCAVATSIFAAVDQDSQFCSTLAGPPSSKTSQLRGLPFAFPVADLRRSFVSSNLKDAKGQICHILSWSYILGAQCV